MLRVQAFAASGFLATRRASDSDLGNCRSSASLPYSHLPDCHMAVAPRLYAALMATPDRQSNRRKEPSLIVTAPAELVAPCDQPALRDKVYVQALIARA